MHDERKKQDRILITAGIVFLCIFCISGYLLLDYWLESREQEKLSAQLAMLQHGTRDEIVIVEAVPITPKETQRAQEIEKEPVEKVPEKEVAQPEPTAEPEEEVTSLSELNPDYVAWIQMPDTPIDYPVVHRDNAYYLRRDFFGKKNRHGTIFLDVSCKEKDTFWLIHGHNMKDGTMFGCLKNLKDAKYRQEHKEFSLIWEEEEKSFEIFAGALVDLYDENRFRYELLPQVKETSQEYLKQLKSAALWYEDVVWEEGQRVVILSTCDYGTEEQRFIVAAIEKR